MRYKFFPGSELGPPKLLGGIVDLDRPQHLIANIFLDHEDQLELRPVVPLSEHEHRELGEFMSEIPAAEFRRITVSEIMHYTTRHRAMC